MKGVGSVKVVGIKERHKGIRMMNRKKRER